MRTRFGKRVIVLLLAIMMVLNSTPVMASSGNATRESSMIGGGLTSMLTLDLSGLAMDYLERTIFLAVGKAIDHEGDSDLGRALTGAKKLMASPVGNSLSNITGLCEEMLEDIELLNAKINACNEKMDYLTQSQHYAAYQEKRAELIAFKDTYNEAFNLFTAFLTAMDAYDKDPSEVNYEAVGAAYGKIEAFYVDNPNVLNGEYTTLEFNFVNDLHEFLQVISPYLPSEAVKSGVHPSDSSYWGNNQQTTTYLDTVFACLKDRYPYEHQILEEMKTACSEVAGIANLYLTVHRMYTEVGAQILAYDGTLTEETREAEIRRLWNSYQDNAYKMVRGLEQLCDLGDTYTEGYMTYLDTNATIEVDNTESWYVTKTLSNNTYLRVWLEEKQIKNDYLEFYQVKTPDSENIYAILKGSSVNAYADQTELSNEDLIDIAAEKEVAGVLTPFRSISGDYLKLTQSESNANYSYSMISSVEDLNGLIGTAEFDGYLYSHLQENLQAADLPASSGEADSFNADAVKSGMMVPLKTSLDDWDASNIGNHQNMDLPAINIAMPLDVYDLERSVVSLDTKEDIAEADGNKTNPLIILKGDVTYSDLNVIFDQMDGDVKTIFEDGTAANEYLKAGTSLIAKVKPYSGETIKSVYLRRVDENNEIIYDEEPYYLAGGAGEEAVSLEEALEACQKDEEGYYHFNFTAPYVNAVLFVEFTDASLGETHKVTLEESEAGVMYFADGGFGLTEKEYHEGDKVIVYIRPYSGYLSAGTNLSLSVADGVETFAPNMRAYSFTMSDHDVTLTPEFKEGKTVELSTVNAGEGCGARFVYDGGERWDDSWIGSPGTFASGDTVTIEFDETEKYYVREVVITDYSSYNYIEGNLSDGRVSFTMPNGNVGVDVVYEQVVARSHTATLSHTGDGNLYFVDDSGNVNNSTKSTFPAGSTVTFKAITDHVWDGEVVAKDYNGNAVAVTSLGDNLYSFVMPDANVEICTDFAKPITVSVIPADGVRVFYFVKDDKIDYAQSKTFWEGDEVIFGCINASELQDYERRVEAILVKDSDGNAVDFAESGEISHGNSMEKTYAFVAGVKDINISAEYETFRFVHLAEGYTEDNFAFRGGDGWFPGGPVYLTWEGDASPADILVTAEDEEGNEVEVVHSSPTSAFFTIYMPETDVYVTAELCDNGVAVESGRYQAPLLNADGYYEIRNAGHLMWFNQFVNHEDLSAKAILMNNIDMTGIEPKWEVLGSRENGFEGIFDGSSFTIHNLNIDREKIQEFKEKHFAVLGEAGVIKNVSFTFDSDMPAEEPVATGDETNLYLWIGLLAASAGTAAWIRRKKA